MHGAEMNGLKTLLVATLVMTALGCSPDSTKRGASSRCTTGPIDGGEVDFCRSCDAKSTAKQACGCSFSCEDDKRVQTCGCQSHTID